MNETSHSSAIIQDLPTLGFDVSKTLRICLSNVVLSWGVD